MSCNLFVMFVRKSFCLLDSCCLAFLSEWDTPGGSWGLKSLFLSLLSDWFCSVSVVLCVRWSLALFERHFYKESLFNGLPPHQGTQCPAPHLAPHKSWFRISSRCPKPVWGFYSSKLWTDFRTDALYWIKWLGPWDYDFCNVAHALTWFWSHFPCISSYLVWLVGRLETGGICLLLLILWFIIFIVIQ